MSRNQTRDRGPREVSSLACWDVSFSLSSSSLLFSSEVTFDAVLDEGRCFPVGVISPRKLPDDRGGYPEGAVPDVFHGEVRRSNCKNN